MIFLVDEKGVRGRKEPQLSTVMRLSLGFEFQRLHKIAHNSRGIDMA